jgi:hypothetical protein
MIVFFVVVVSGAGEEPWPVDEVENDEEEYNDYPRVLLQDFNCLFILVKFLLLWFGARAIRCWDCLWSLQLI